MQTTSAALFLYNTSCRTLLANLFSPEHLKRGEGITPSATRLSRPYEGPLERAGRLCALVRVHTPTYRHPRAKDPLLEDGVFESCAKGREEAGCANQRKRIEAGRGKLSGLVR